MAARALWGVSTSAPMPRYPEYVAAMSAVEQQETSRNPSGDELWRGLLAQTATGASFGKRALPWSAVDSTATRVVAAITSFTDDYGGSYPSEFFPPDLALGLLGALLRRWAEKDEPLGIVEQYRLGLQFSDGHPLGAAVLMHAVSRAIARGRDTRALPMLTMSLGERISICGLFAAFSEKESNGGDPAGDTYHYWAMVVGGAWCAGERQGAVVRGTRALLLLGADLMWLVRDQLFGSPLFFGRHKWIDRLGLEHGQRLAVACGLTLSSVRNSRNTPKHQARGDTASWKIPNRRGDINARSAQDRRLSRRRFHGRLSFRPMDLGPAEE